MERWKNGKMERWKDGKLISWWFPNTPTTVGSPYGHSNTPVLQYSNSPTLHNSMFFFFYEIVRTLNYEMFRRLLYWVGFFLPFNIK